MFEIKSIYDERITFKIPRIYSASAEGSIKSKLKPEEFELLKSHFNRFYDYTVKHIKKINRVNFQKYRDTFEILFFAEFSNFISHNENYINKTLSNNFIIEQFIYQRFFYANLVFTVLFGSTASLERLQKMDRKIYPDGLFPMANDIYTKNYKSDKKMTYEKALINATKSFPEFVGIDFKGKDFGNMITSYKKYRTHNV